MIGGIALLEDQTVRSEHRFIKGMVHGKYLIPVLKRALARAHWKLEDIDLIAVDIGPGSYTGLRVGVATAKTLAYTLQTNLVGVASLDIMAENGPLKYDFICPMIDARWNQLYTAIYKRDSSLPPPRRGSFRMTKGNGHYERITDYLAITPEEFKRSLPREVLIFGDALIKYREVFKRAGIGYGAKSKWIPLAKNVARLGLEAFQQGKRDDYFSLVPLYLRPTEAEMKLKEKRGKRRLS